MGDGMGINAVVFGQGVVGINGQEPRGLEGEEKEWSYVDVESGDQPGPVQHTRRFARNRAKKY